MLVLASIVQRKVWSHTKFVQYSTMVQKIRNLLTEGTATVLAGCNFFTNETIHLWEDSCITASQNEGTGKAVQCRIGVLQLCAMQ